MLFHNIDMNTTLHSIKLCNLNTGIQICIKEKSGIVAAAIREKKSASFVPKNKITETFKLLKAFFVTAPPIIIKITIKTGQNNCLQPGPQNVTFRHCNIHLPVNVYLLPLCPAALSISHEIRKIKTLK